MNLSRRLESSLNRSVLRLRSLTRNGFIHWYGHDACTLRVLGLAVAIVASLLGGCQEMAQPQTGSIQLKGSEMLRPLLIMCAEDFMTRQPHIDVIV